MSPVMCYAKAVYRLHGGWFDTILDEPFINLAIAKGFTVKRSPNGDYATVVEWEK